MSTKRIRTEPDWSLSSPEHIEIVAQKNKDYLSSWQYNVQDHLKSKSLSEIRQRLKNTAFPFAVCSESWNSDFNLSCLIRTANGFNAEAVYYLGNKHYDRRGATGTYHYTDTNFIPSVNDFLALKSRYTFVGIDNVPGSVSIDDYDFPERPLFIFGSEGTGLTPTMQSYCQDIVRIEQFGSVRSFNAAVASGIVMHTYISFIQRECGHSTIDNNQCVKCHKRFQ